MNPFNIDLIGRKVVLRGDGKEGDRTFLVKGGFGAKATTQGRTLFGQFVADGGHGTINAMDCIKVLADD